MSTFKGSHQRSLAYRNSRLTSSFDACAAEAPLPAETGAEEGSTDMHVITAWKEWWDGIGHVARSNRDPGRTREAFEAGYLAALEQVSPARRPSLLVPFEMIPETNRSDGVRRQ